MTGWYSKQKMAQNKLYGKAISGAKAPEMDWRAQLLAWEKEATTRYLVVRSSTSASLDIISDCMDRMQEKYPGKYRLEWAETKPNEYHLIMTFPDAKHESIWRLQYA